MNVYVNIEVIRSTADGDRLVAAGEHGSLSVTLKAKIPAKDQAKLLAEIYCEKYKLPPPGSLNAVSAQHWQLVKCTAREELKSKSISALKGVLGITLLISGLYLWGLWGERPPEIPSASESVNIVLREPGTGKVIVDKVIVDKATIGNMAALFSQGEECSDHKCPSIGEILFVGKTESKALEVLPGHDVGKYEFRFDGRMFCLARVAYIFGLIDAGIDEKDVRLDGHPKSKLKAEK